MRAQVQLAAHDRSLADWATGLVLVACLAATACQADTAAGGTPAAERTGSPTKSSPMPSPSKQPSQSTSEAPADLPNIALHPDGKTPVLCSEWPRLDPDIQYGMTFNALIKSQVIPATPNLVHRAKDLVRDDCRTEPKSVAYVVALRAAMTVDPA